MRAINWTHAEKESLVHAAKQIKAVTPSIGDRELLAAAMEQVLSEERRRDADRVNGGNFDWFLEALGIVRRTNKVVWDRSERAAVIEKAARIRSEGTVLREIDLLKKAMVVLPTDRRRFVTSMVGRPWDWFRVGIAEAMKNAPVREKDDRPAEAIGEIRERVAEVAKKSQEHLMSDLVCEELGEDKSQVRLLKELEVRVARIERDLYEGDTPTPRG